MAEKEAKALTVPYVPYKTFTSVLDSFVAFLPDAIDATMWPSYSGGTKSQILGALKFLGLITDSGAPSADLRKMSDNKEARPVVMAAVLRRSYPQLFALDLAKATPGSFDKILRDEYKQEGETHRKAASFFLLAAKNAGIPLSPPLTAKGRLAPSKRKANTGLRPRAGVVVPPPVDPLPSNGPTKTITLESGVTLTLAANKDSFQMSKADRDFVFELLGRMEEYENDIAGITESDIDDAEGAEA